MVKHKREVREKQLRSMKDKQVFFLSFFFFF